MNVLLGTVTFHFAATGGDRSTVRQIQTTAWPPPEHKKRAAILSHRLSQAASFYPVIMDTLTYVLSLLELASFILPPVLALTVQLYLEAKFLTGKLEYLVDLAPRKQPCFLNVFECPDFADIQKQAKANLCDPRFISC